ncbi:MAG: threonine synthase [Spirochaetaceae bacterium]|jgi:threonine synthase|nr:threonine synthase [Spirochaetaceae bacterium]
MLFCSTVYKNTAGDKTPAVPFKEAILQCLPEEGGLFIPKSVPDLRHLLLHMGEETSYPELVAAVSPLLFEGDLNPSSASRMAEGAFTFEPELLRLDRNFSVLTLYGGPTGVFKDFGITFLAALLEELLKNDTAMVVSASRGKTGVSIAKAFQNRRNIVTTLLYPDENIYGLDRESYVPEGGNVIPIRVKGTLDDCQRLIGELIRDRSFSERYKVTSANAINPGRLLPQAFYFLYSFIRLKKHITGELLFSIPSGNLGNLIAGLYAWKFGMPVNGYIAAMNINNPSGDFIKSGNFEDLKSSPIVPTVSSALDISRPANYERLVSFYKESPAVMKNMVYTETVDDARTLGTMERVWKKYRLHLDPHGAVAFAAAEKMAAERNFDGHIVILATVHPAKYAEETRKATGQRLELPDRLASLNRPAEPVAEIKPALEGLESAIASCFYTP